MRIATRPISVLALLALGAATAPVSARAGEGGLAISPDGKRVAVSGDRTIELADATSVRFRARSTHGPRGVAFSPDGRLLASCGDDETVWIRDAATLKEVRRITGPRIGVAEDQGVTVRDIPEPLNTVAFSPDGRLVAAAGHGGYRTVRLWDVATGREVIRLDGARDAVYSVSFSRDGTRLAAGSFDGDVHVWDLLTRRETHRLSCRDAVYSVAFSPDDQLLASAVADGSVRLWDPATGKEVRRLRGGPRSWLHAVAFSPDGRRLVAGGHDKTVRVWETASGREIGHFGVEFGDVWSVGFALGGRRLIARSSQGDRAELRSWDLDRVDRPGADPRPNTSGPGADP